MRALLALIGLAALVVVVLTLTGMMTFTANSGSLPSLHWEGGKAPSVQANVAHISVGMENKTVAVPTVTTTDKTIAVPTMKLDKPGDTSTANAQ
jgi:hypothetical protein